MVKYFESKTVFHFTWEQVAQAFWQRYPNPESSHVLSEDTIEREMRGNKLFSKRLLTKTNRVPKWGERFISTPVVKILEESVVDPQAKTLTTYTRNLGYSKVMSLVEKVVYRVSEENGDWTVAERSAWVDSQVLGFGRAIQAFGIDRFKKNCSKMVRGFNSVLGRMFPRAPAPSPAAAAPALHASESSASASARGLRTEKLKDAAKKALANSKPIYASSV